MGDWAMMALRHELHLMAHAFRREINDPERTGIHLDHLAFYYQKYYSKQIVAKTYGVESFNDLVALIQDTVVVTDKHVLDAHLDDEMETLQIFVKLTEEDRRHRNLRIDLGEESAKLKFAQHQQNGNKAQAQSGWQQGGAQGWNAGSGMPQLFAGAQS